MRTNMNMNTNTNTNTNTSMDMDMNKDMNMNMDTHAQLMNVIRDVLIEAKMDVQMRSLVKMNIQVRMNDQRSNGNKEDGKRNSSG